MLDAGAHRVEQDLVLSIPALIQHRGPGRSRISCVLGGTFEAWTNMAGVRGVGNGQVGAKEMA